MKHQALEKLRYPIGKFEWKHEMSQENFEFHKKKIANYPNSLENKIKDLSGSDLEKNTVKEVGKFLN